MKINKVKTLVGLACVFLLLTGCTSDSEATRESVPSTPEIPTAEIEKLTAKAACQEFESVEKFFGDLLKILLRELTDDHTRKNRLERLGAELVEGSRSLVEIKVEDPEVERVIVKFGTDMATFGQTFVDRYDFVKDDESTDALRELEISIIKAYDICGLS